jgi:hypothetical protein
MTDEKSNRIAVFKGERDDEYKNLMRGIGTLYADADNVSGCR